jgi:hypothetical protein
LSYYKTNWHLKSEKSLRNLGLYPFGVLTYMGISTPGIVYFHLIMRQSVFMDLIRTATWMYQGRKSGRNWPP